MFCKGTKLFFHDQIFSALFPLMEKALLLLGSVLRMKPYLEGMPHVKHCIFGTVEHHSWPNPAHHLLNLLTLLWRITVDGTPITGFLVFSEPTMFEAQTSILCQKFIVLWQCVLLQMVAAIKRYHLADCPLFPLNPVHLYLKRLS